MTEVLAFHGQGSSPARMRYDCGNPDWITHYADWTNADPLPSTPFVAVGYSLGGAHIAELSHLRSVHLLAVIVYESPVWELPKQVNCPVCIVWNDYTPKLQHASMAIRRASVGYRAQPAARRLGRGARNLPANASVDRPARTLIFDADYRGV